MNITQNLKEAIIIFDTSALIDMYLYSDESKKDIIDNIFNKLKGRLWLPNKVMQEYKKHRLTKIFLPVTKYNELLQKDNNTKDKGYFNEIDQSLTKIVGYTNTLKQETSKNNRHPFFENDFLKEFEESVKKSQEILKHIKNNTENKLAVLKNKIQNKIDSNSDEVFNAIKEYFDEGDEYNFAQILEIIKEGDFRYKHEIPPGYKDALQKKDINKFSDLIIWKQILDFAQEKKQDIIFICNDTKEDWCHRLSGDKDRIDSPREELMFEIKSFAGVGFTMYTTHQFLYHSKDLFDSKISEETIAEVTYEIENKIHSFLLYWAQEHYSIKSVQNHYLYKPLNYHFDLYLTLTNGKKVGIEYRGMKIEKYNINRRLLLGKELIRNNIIDEFCLLILSNEDESYYNELLMDNNIGDEQSYIRIIMKK